MKTLTIKQPWATLIAKGYKEYEFRTWKTKYRGEFLIHAGKGADKEAIKRFKHLDLTYPRGCIIAKAKLTDCIQVDDPFRDKVAKKSQIVYKNIIDDKTWQGYAFKLENVCEIEPVKTNGKLSFWDFNYNV